MQVNHFIRRHPFLQTSLVRHTTSERRSFEKDIYDYARGLGLSPGEAHKEVFKGRGLCGEEEYHSDDTALGDEVDDSANTLRRLSTPSVSMLEQSHSSQPSDVPAIAKTPRGRSRRKKQSTMDPLVNADAQVVVMEAEVSAAQCESVQVPRCRSKTSKDTTSKFFPNECELGKKRKRKTADETDVPEQKKPKKEAKKKKSKKVDGQATANTQIDQDIQFTHSPSNPEGHGKGGDVPAKPRAPTDDAVEGKEDLDTVGQRGEVTAKSKNRKKMKKRKDKSKGSETTTATTSTSAAESLSIVVAADVGSDLNGLATADKSTDHEVNEPLSKQHLSATPKPVVASEANGDHALNLEAVRESWRATRRLRKQIRRRAINKAKRQLRAENNAAAVSPPVTKIAKPDENDKAHDDHQINQTTELPTSSINDLMGTSGLSKKDRPGSTAPAVAHEPIDPKSTMEARRNLLRSAKPESVEYGTTATISKHDLKEIKNIPLLEEEAGESQADEEHAAKKRLRKRKSGDKKEHATNDADSDNVKTKKVKQVKTEVGPTPTEPGFQSPMIQ